MKDRNANDLRCVSTRDLRAAINKLPPSLKAYALEDLACGGDAHHAVVAERLGICPVNAKQRRSRAKRRLGDLLSG